MRLGVIAALLCAAIAAQPSLAQVDEAGIESLADQAKFTGSIGVSARWGDGITGTVQMKFNRAKAGKADKGYNSTHWRWASVTKQVIAVLILQEVGKGTVDLDRPVAQYLPGFASANASKLTVRQLLQHRSGLPNPNDTAATPEDMPAFYLPGYKGDRNPLTGYCAGTVKQEPGGNWAYNNCDYMVAGALLEAITGKSWQSLVRERIAKPLRLLSLQPYPAKGLTRTGLVDGKPEPVIDIAAFGASGALYGSVEDLLKFDQALMSGELLGKEQLDMLWDGRPELGYMALGQWAFEAPLKGCAKPVRIIERRGAIGGVQVRNFIAPDKQIAVAVFADQSEDDFAFGEIWQGSGFSHDILSIALCNKPAEAQ